MYTIGYIEMSAKKYLCTSPEGVSLNDHYYHLLEVGRVALLYSGSQFLYSLWFKVP